MRWLTFNAELNCSHGPGKVVVKARQDWVYIDGVRVLVATDPEQKRINTCNWVGPGQTPCTLSLTVTDGYSSLIRIDDNRVCLDTVTGPTNGSPGTFSYSVSSPGKVWWRQTNEHLRRMAFQPP